MPLRPTEQERGLSAISEARRTRRRALVFGKVRLREVATRFWLFTFAGILVFGVIYYRYAQSKLERQRNQLAARQRAVALAAGKGAFAFRDKLESWVQSLAQREVATLVAPAASLDEISRGPGVYLRLPLSEADSPERTRRAAARSLHDGFTSCLFIGRAGDPSVGTACKSKAQCGPGELCNDWGVCAAPGQPYNLRLLYDALKVLGPEWDERLQDTRDELQVRAMELELEDSAKHDVPAATELVRRSKYFTVVLDETPSEPAVALPADAGVEESLEERLQASDHFARVGIWDIQRGEPLLRLRFEVAGRFVSLGRADVGSAAVRRARQRQVNNCAAALEVREALMAQLGAASGAAAVEERAPAQASAE